MESPVLTLVVAFFSAANVESQQNVNPPRTLEFSPPPPRLPPSVLPESPPRPLTSPLHLSPPRPSTPPSVLPPPPLTPTPPLPPPLAYFHPLRPFSQSPSPTLQFTLPHSSHQSTPPPSKHLHPALPEHGNHSSYRNLSPPLEREKPNMGKKIGLMFIVIASILQICFLTFLLIRRRQLLKSENGN